MQTIWKSPRGWRMEFSALIFLLLFAAQSFAEPWWSSKSEEEKIQVDAGIFYRRYLYQTVINKPVRAHVLSVTGVGSQYVFGVLGSYGALFAPSDFARQSEALAAVNGGFFSVRPNRARGLVAAHGRILYPPHQENYRSTVGFNSSKILFDWIGPEDIDKYRFQTQKPGWNDCHAALAAGPILIKDGTTCLYLAESFNLNERNPRTAIAQMADGMALMVVVDGRQPDWSAGVTLGELTDMLADIGASDAMNLDGGGSSVMVVNNKLMNRPSDFALPGSPGKERAVANVVALFKK
ncbi:MAG: phosphodiester glycosidase family protein [Candidatus Omnitrophota bacterium]